MDPFEPVLTAALDRASRRAGVTPVYRQYEAMEQETVNGLKSLMFAAGMDGRDTIPVEVLDRMVTGVHDRMVPATTSQEAAS